MKPCLCLHRITFAELKHSPGVIPKPAVTHETLLHQTLHFCESRRWCMLDVQYFVVLYYVYLVTLCSYVHVSAILVLGDPETLVSNVLYIPQTVGIVSLLMSFAGQHESWSEALCCIPCRAVQNWCLIWSYAAVAATSIGHKCDPSWIEPKAQLCSAAPRSASSIGGIAKSFWYLILKS